MQSMEVLWVRWYGMVPDHRNGSASARLPKVSFVSDSDPAAFGFLDPSLIIRASHLIPAFYDGRTTSLLKAGPSLGRAPDEVDDWDAYYINM